MKSKAFMLASSAIAGIIGLSAVASAQRPTAHAPQIMNSGATAGQPNDATLNNEVRSALARDALTRSSNIRVTTQDRMVILRGTVPSRRAAQRAEQLASRVNGVKGIEDRTEPSKSLSR